MMKLLYLGINRQYFNKNLQLFPKLVADCGQAKFIGPGFSKPTELTKNYLVDYVEKMGPDLLLCDMDTFAYEFFGEKFLRGSLYDFDIKQMSDFADGFNKLLWRLDCPVVVYCNFDFYHAPIELIQKLIKYSVFVIARDKEFWRPKSELQDLEMEKFSDVVNDNWFSYVSSYDDKVISLPGFVASNEIYKETINRDIDISVLGVKYYSRLQAISAIKKTQINCVTGETRRKIVSKLMQIFPSRMSHKSYNDDFVNILKRSKTSFTCGSALGYPIRKFFEIPASGSLLLCKPFQNFENLGFSSGENCFAVSANNVAEIVRDIVSNYQDYQRICDSAHELIHTKHTYDVRLMQLRCSLEAIIKNEFKGSYWSKGSFKLR